MSAPIRPPTPRMSEDTTIHRSKSFYGKMSPLSNFLDCLSDETVIELLTNMESDYKALEALDTPLPDEKDGTTREQYISARRWIKEHEIVSKDEFIKRVREKQFGHVLRGEVNSPKRK
jgi:hypothetical protein